MVSIYTGKLEDVVNNSQVLWRGWVYTIWGMQVVKWVGLTTGLRGQGRSLFSLSGR